MKNQTLSIEQMKHLKALGVDVSKASMVCLFIDEDCNEIDWDSVENHGKDKPLYEWYDDENDHWVEATPEYFAAESGTYDHSNRESCGVFTLQDMLDMIPVLYQTKDGMSPTSKCDGDTTYYPSIYKDEEGEYSCEYISSESDTWIGFSNFSPIESAYLMLCWCAENGHLKGGKP